jgi:hypothetical protein
LSDLLVRLALDASGLDVQLKGVSKKFKEAAKSIAAITLPVAAVAGIAKMVDGLAAIGERAIEAAGSLQDTSEQLGVTAERLQELRLVAQNAGVDVGTFDKSLGILNRTLGQAAMGQGNFEKIAKQAGISLRNEQGEIKTTAEVWDALTAKVQSGALSQNEAIGLAAAAFGRGGGVMVQILKQTAEEQQKVIDTARRFGAILSNEVVASADEYGDQLALIKKGTEALGIQSGMILAPLTIKWAEMKNEIAGAVTELARASGLIDNNTFLMERQLRQLEETINAHREYLALTKHPAPEQDALLQKWVADWVKLKNTIEEAKKAAAGNVKPPERGAGGDVELSDEDAKAELALVTAVYAERDRLALEEIAAETQRAEEKARILKQVADYELGLVMEELAQMETLRLEGHEKELAQEQAWAEVMAAERERAAGMEIEQYLAKEGMLTEARREGMEARLAFDQMEAGQKVATTIGALTKITAAVAQHSKKAFELNKLAAIANAIVNTAQGATKALAQGGFAGIAMAAAVIGAGAVQIAAIKKTQYQGGGTGTTPSAVGTTPVVNSQPVSGGGGSAQPGSVIRVEGLNGASLFNGKAVRELLERLQDAQKDGGRLVIA